MRQCRVPFCRCPRLLLLASLGCWSGCEGEDEGSGSSCAKSAEVIVADALPCVGAGDPGACADAAEDAGEAWYWEGELPSIDGPGGTVVAGTANQEFGRDAARLYVRRSASAGGGQYDDPAFVRVERCASIEFDAGPQANTQARCVDPVLVCDD